MGNLFTLDLPFGQLDRPGMPKEKEVWSPPGGSGEDLFADWEIGIFPARLYFGSNIFRVRNDVETSGKYGFIGFEKILGAKQCVIIEGNKVSGYANGLPYGPRVEEIIRSRVTRTLKLDHTVLHVCSTGPWILEILFPGGCSVQMQGGNWKDFPNGTCIFGGFGNCSFRAARLLPKPFWVKVHEVNP